MEVLSYKQNQTRVGSISNELRIPGGGLAENGSWIVHEGSSQTSAGLQKKHLPQVTEQPGVDSHLDVCDDRLFFYICHCFILFDGFIYILLNVVGPSMFFSGIC